MLIREQHRLAKEAAQKSESWQYKALMAIPKNLVYVFVCVIVLAFIGMLYIVYTEHDISIFSESEIIQEHVVVHPLFNFFQNKFQFEENVHQTTLEHLSQQEFYQDYMSKSNPLLVIDGCEDWFAKEKWKDFDYLEDKFGLQSLEIMRLDRGNVDLYKKQGKELPEFNYKSGYSRRNTFNDFLNRTANFTFNDRYMYYLYKQIIANKELLSDLIKPQFLSKIIRSRHVGLTIWEKFVRKVESNDRESYFCVLQGEEKFSLVSPIFKQNVYSGVFEELTPQETPLNFFNVNTTQYPLWQSVRKYEVTLVEGQCLYIPAFYWFQIETLSEGKSILVSFDYESHSEFVSLLFQAIDIGILEED